MELEEIMSKLEDTVGRMEKENLTLEESYLCFSKGMEYVKEGNKAIDQIEKKIEILMGEEEIHE